MANGYWTDCVIEALQQADIVGVNRKQIDTIADIVEGAASVYQEQTVGITNDKKLNDGPIIKTDPIICEQCNGKGIVTTLLPYHTASSDCIFCNGKGIVLNRSRV